MKLNPIWKQHEKDIVIHNDKMNMIESCLDRHAIKTPDKLALSFEFENKSKIIDNWRYCSCAGFGLDG